MNLDYTFIVTGCTGYVGNVLTKELLRLGCRVVGLARSEEKFKRVFGDNGPSVVYGDIRNKEDLEKLFGTKVYLNLWVKVKEKWRESARTVSNFGYNDEN